MANFNISHSRNMKVLYVLSFLLSLAFVIGGIAYYNFEKSLHTREAHQNLSAVSELKIAQLVQWHKERTSEAQFFSGNDLFVTAFNSWLVNKTTSLAKHFYEPLTLIKANHKYKNIFVVSPKGEVLLSIDSSFDQLESTAFKYLNECISKKKVIFSDFYISNGKNGIIFDIVAPIYCSVGNVCGALFMRVDPEEYLYPLIQSWPTPSYSAESIIVRKEADSVVILNELRFRKNTALSFKMPLTDTAYTIVKAANGYEGIVKAQDYREDEVLSVIARVPGTNWIMLSEIDTAEILSELRYRSIFVILIIALLVALLGVILSSIFKAKQSNLYKSMFEAEKKLKEANEAYRIILYSIGDAVITTDESGRISKMNRVAENLTGYSEYEGQGQPLEKVFNIINEETRERVENPVQKVLNEGKIVGLANHTILISSDGKETPIADSGAPIKDLSGNTIGVVLVFRDQSDERQNQKILQESELRYRSLFESNPNPMLVFDLESLQIMEVNDSAIQKYGYSREEFLSLTIKEMRPEEDLPKLMQKLSAPIEGIDNAGVWRHKKKDGEIILVDIVSHPINWKDRSSEVVLITDVTESKIAEDKIRYQARLLDEVGQSVIVTDQNGLITYWNRAAEELYGWKAEEVIGQEIMKVIPTDLSMEQAKEVMSLLYQGKPWSGEFLAKKRNGDEFYIYVNDTPVLDENGNLTSIIGVSKDISERKQADDEIRRSRNLLSRIFDILPVGLWFADKYGTLLRANPAGKKIWGAEPLVPISEYGVFKAKRLPSGENIAPDDWALLHTIREGITIKDELLEIEAFDGVNRIILNYTAPILDDNDQVEGAIIVNLDITELKRAEQELKLSEDKFRRLAEDMPVYISAFLPNGELTYANHAIAAFTPFASDELIGKNFLEMLPEQDSENLRKQLSTLTKDNPISRQEQKYVAPNGEVFYHEWINRALFDDSGKLLHYQAIGMNITDKVQIMQALQESESRYEKFINTMNDIAFVKDQENRYIVVNKELAKFFGKSPSEIFGKTDFELTDERTALVCAISDERAKNSGNPITTEETIGDKIFETTKFAIPLKGNKTGIGGIIRDITQKRITEKETLEAKQKAEESDRLKSAFLANMSHEIRTPLNGIIGFSDLLKDSSLPESEKNEYVNIIKQSSARLMNLVNDLINISKIETGQMEVNKIHCNVNKLIRDISAFFKPQFTNKNISFTFHLGLDDSEADIITDEQKVYQIIVNLLNNAQRFTSKGKITLGYSLKGNLLEFFVKDTGTGINAKTRKVIFDRFRQGDSAYTTTHEGAGLGLAISKGFVNLLNGRIWVDSEENKGSVFYFTIPYQKSISQIKVTEEIEKKPIKEKSDKTILIVEDDDVNYLLIKRIVIKELKCSTIRASNGFSAIEQFKNNPHISLIIMDIKMPEMDGFEAFQLIRQMNQVVPIIAITAYALVEAKDKIINMGFNDYISKPFEISDVIEILERHLVQ